MSALIMEGKPIAKAIEAEAMAMASLLTSGGVTPRLGIVLVGDDPGSAIYTSSIERAASRVEITADVLRLPSDSTRSSVVEAIEAMNRDPSTHGIIVQQPLPKGVPVDVVDLISPEKDLDGASAQSIGRLAMGREGFAPCTARGVLEILSRSGVEVFGKHVVILGRSTVVGRPLAILLLRKSKQANATVTVCHTGTPDIGIHARTADIVVAAMGVPEAVRADMVRDGVVVVDVGVSRIDDPDSKKGYRIVGDVAFDEVGAKASAITPVPGGVGALTTAILIRSVVEAAEQAGRGLHVNMGGSGAGRA